MFEPNIQNVLSKISPSDVVLDIGGWGYPFNRANYVMDSEPYETRGYYSTFGKGASQGGDKEYFTGETWIRRDICEKAPFPFQDKAVDFVICSHVLEDIRDPLWVCSEMIRIAKRGYIEIPSRTIETCRGWESERIAGLTHHRWLIGVDQDRKHIDFLMKHHMIHSDRRFSFPRSFFQSLPESQRIAFLFWEGSFTYSERIIHGLNNVAAELSNFVANKFRYPRWTLAIDRWSTSGRSLYRRVQRRLFHIKNPGP